MEIGDFIESCRKESPCEMEIRYNENMADHCTFKTGGPADCFIRPSGADFPAFAQKLIAATHARDIPVFFLGGGANILIADAGIRGIVIDICGWTGETGRRLSEGLLEFRSGTSSDSAAEIAAENGLSGLEFLAGMPGSIGGALWMNARCYGREIADVLFETEIIDFTAPKPELKRLPINQSEFGYKLSPFQGRDVLILSAVFHLTPVEKDGIRAEMNAHRADREAKGHYRSPSAGSVFKNNPVFGKPSGQIIDELGLCGLDKGGAQVAPWHGNMIINRGGASSSDIRALIDEVAARVKAATGFVLEPEVLFVGEWQETPRVPTQNKIAFRR
jgi:UDP-N-acetylmuramate dehydrogenase